MLTLWLTVAVATADTSGLTTCCAEAGAEGCPDTVEVVGPGSRLDDRGVQGIWQLTCDGGAHWFPQAHRAGSHARGDVLTPMDAASRACFDAACPLPASVCLVDDPDGPRAQACGTAIDLVTAHLLTQPVRRIPVVVEGRVVHARAASLTAMGLEAVPPRAISSTTPDSHPAPTSPIARPRGASTVTRAAPAPRTSARSSTPAVSAKAPPPVRSTVPVRPTRIGTPRATATTSTAPTPRRSALAYDVDSTVTMALQGDRLPGADGTCAAAAARRAADAQVLAGDDALVAQDFDQAWKRYKAALLVDPCHAHGWSAAGRLFARAGRAGEARAALDRATTLDPTLVTAWVALGEAQERLGRPDAARTAYRRALTLRPGFPSAQAGLARLAP